ncbi:hypothetical protein LDENG_00019920 [Lucifuga dentata]|nr:hypothetical protein LDENG_00019920 [Lucifuga dentata]
MTPSKQPVYFCLLSVTCSQPPEVEHAKTIGSTKEHYPVFSIIRYQCDAGYTQRKASWIRCNPNGEWEEPEVECRSEFPEQQMLK